MTLITEKDKGNKNIELVCVKQLRGRIETQEKVEFWMLHAKGHIGVKHELSS